MNIAAHRAQPGEPSAAPSLLYRDTPNRAIVVDGTVFAYRDLGPCGGVPVLVLNYWGGTLDDMDPSIVDGLAQSRRVIVADYRGIGGSGGTAPLTIAAMAHDMIALIGSLGIAQVDLLGTSFGGFVAQDIVRQAPQCVRKLILASSGPAGGTGIDKVGAISLPQILKGALTRRDPKYFLFFTASQRGRHAATAFLDRLTERTQHRDKPLSPRAFWRQLQAIKAWARQPAQDLSSFTMPVLITAGDHDRLVPPVHSDALARRIPHAQLIVYQDAGHGAAFQYHAAFVASVLAFLDR
ncbi:alpha/beta fold hydrolase [Xanthomonas campestris]|uniref:alpha/beta fold hydrolase n=1 Tax=Xanthomonas campestris TaxID=339 RepID=UPI003CE8F310